ncbi:MAG: insulinase family protein [Saprospiraceae bacterium]|nr:insulinase family protein [Saprospiraceae bacterium]
MGLDGPFNTAEMTKTLILDGLPLDFFDTLINTIKSITPTQIQAMAQKYLNIEDMWEIMVGEQVTTGVS